MSKMRRFRRKTILHHPTHSLRAQLNKCLKSDIWHTLQKLVMKEKIIQNSKYETLSETKKR